MRETARLQPHNEKVGGLILTLISSDWKNIPEQSCGASLSVCLSALNFTFLQFHVIIHTMAVRYQGLVPEAASTTQPWKKANDVHKNRIFLFTMATDNK